jgi:hypothetical protein
VIRPRLGAKQGNKDVVRFDILRARIHEAALPMVYMNVVGTLDELVFNRGPFVLDAQGQPARSWRSSRTSPQSNSKLVHRCRRRSRPSCRSRRRCAPRS